MLHSSDEERNRPPKSRSPLGVHITSHLPYKRHSLYLRIYLVIDRLVSHVADDDVQLPHLRSCVYTHYIHYLHFVNRFSKNMLHSSDEERNRPPKSRSPLGVHITSHLPYKRHSVQLSILLDNLRMEYRLHSSDEERNRPPKSRSPLGVHITSHLPYKRHSVQLSILLDNLRMEYRFFKMQCHIY